MMKILLLTVATFMYSIADTPIYMLKSSSVQFFAGTPVEDIEATNEKAISFINIKTGEVTIAIRNDQFVFKSPLMQEHFNENYMESSKYPKIEFKGKIDKAENVNWQSTDPFQIEVTGTLTLHGVSKSKTISVNVEIKDNQINGATKFNVVLADYKIDRPKILWEKLAETIDVNATFIYEPYKK